MTPADRSNSPPIISSDTDTAMMPIVELAYSTVASDAARRNASATSEKKTNSDDRADQRADLGPAEQLAQQRPRARRRSSAGGAVAPMV